MKTKNPVNPVHPCSSELGGFASGTVAGIRTRRYHALLLVATTPPTGRVLLVNGFDAWVETAAGSFPISSQVYTPEVIHPDGARRIETFEAEPWPRWGFRLEDGARIEQEIFVPSGAPVVAVSWRLCGSQKGVTLSVRPFLSGCDSPRPPSPGVRRCRKPQRGTSEGWRQSPARPCR